MRKYLFLIFFALVLIPFFAFSQNSEGPIEQEKTVTKLAVTNFVDKPETNLGEQYKDRKAQCSVMNFDLKDFNVSDLKARETVAGKLQSVGLKVVNDVDEFKQAEEGDWPKTVIYQKITSASGCPSGTEEYELSQTQNGPDNPVTTAADNKCAHDEKSITIAVNNYPEGISDHSVYYKKFNDNNWRCSVVKIPVSKPDQGIKGNLSEIKSYIEKNLPSAKIVADKSEFDKLSGDDMKSAIILNSTKCECVGPNSVDYAGLAFKDGNKILERPDTTYKGNLQIGADLDPNNPNVSVGSRSAGPNSTGETVGGDKTGKDDIAQTDEKGNVMIIPPSRNEACVTKNEQLVCFADKSAQDNYKLGGLDTLIETATKAIYENRTKSKDGKGKVSVLIITSPVTYSMKLGNLSGPAVTCAMNGSCRDVADNALGEEAVNKIISESEKQGTTSFMTYVSYSRAVPQNSNWYQEIKSGNRVNFSTVAWDRQLFKSAIDHEWAHHYDFLGSDAAQCQSTSHYSLVSCNKNFSFAQVYGDVIGGKTSGNYPACMESILGKATGGGHITGAGNEGEGATSPAELFASVFQAINSKSSYNTLKAQISGLSDSDSCRTNLEKLISDFKKIMPKIFQNE